MSAIGVLHFTLMLLLVGGALRVVEYLFPENRIVQAIGVIY